MRSCFAVAALSLLGTQLGCDAGSGSEGFTSSGATTSTSGGSSSTAGNGGSAGNAAGTGGGGTTGGGTGGVAGSAGSSGSGSGGSGMLGGGMNGFFPTTLTQSHAESAYTSWKSGYLADCGANGIRVKYDDQSQTVSEGIGYGALLSAAWNDKATFDGIWNYYQKAAAAADAKKGTSRGLMGWQVYADACTFGNMDPGAASDGDLDMAMGLLQAECQWGGGTYLAGATKVIAAIKQFMTKSVPSGTVLLPGDNWGDNTYCMNPSYFSPGYYRVFAKAIAADAAFWNKMADDSYTFLSQSSNASTGLPGEWAANGSGNCTMTTSWYGYNAARTPWRIATDYVWFGTPAAKALLDKITGHVEGAIGGAQLGSIKDGFDNSSVTLGDLGKGNSVFVGAFAVGAMATSQAAADSFNTAFLAVPPENDAVYFKASLRALYMLLAANKFSPGCY